MIKQSGRIIPVLLSGGAGTRLWPLSRETYPKQLLSLLGEKTLLQQAALRVNDPTLFGNLMVVANVEHRFAIADQLRSIDVVDPTMILEPFGRNTAAAVAVAALAASERDPDAIILAMPVDHWIKDAAAFRTAVQTGAAAAKAGKLALFGIQPTLAATGFGYIRIGKQLMGATGSNEVSGFVEKPSQERARELIAAGDYVWNSGIFLLPVRIFLKELQKFAPDVLSACKASLKGATKDLDFLRLEKDAFEASPSVSIDYSVMEKTEHAAVVSTDFGWSDVGSWTSLWDGSPQDKDGKTISIATPQQSVQALDESLKTLKPTHIVFNGKKGALLGKNALTAKVGEKVLFITSQANRDTRFHLIGG
ncbi:MAG: NTP transferase domain-containing protein, partial [Rhizobiales bacterium]|nr:NTP transferase domain-containing protein [Hyphomicrobiales bacterium]